MSKLFIRTLYWVLGVVAAIAIYFGTAFGIASKSNTGAQVAPIAVVFSTRNNPFFQNVEKGIEAAAKELGVAYEVYDSQNDTDKEATNISNIIAKQQKVVIFNDVNEDSGISAVKKLNAAGIKVIATDHLLNSAKAIQENIKVEANIASDNKQAGVILAQFMAQKIGLPQDALTYSVYGIPGTESGESRAQGFIQTVKGKNNQAVKYNLYSYAKYGQETANGKTYVGRQADDNRDKANTAVSNDIGAFFTEQSKRPELVFGTNDESALGAIAALEAAKIPLGGGDSYTPGSGKVYVTGVDYTEDAQIAVKNNKLSATVEQDTDLLGKLSLEIAAKILDNSWETSKYEDFYNKHTGLDRDKKPTDTVEKGYYFKVATKLFWKGPDGKGEKLQADQNGILQKVS
ncbi:substrate-binding domain-containing protein [Mycoplasma sp. 1654_15]|uniref:substrate-binding domain-containing protein n=1 Tax=Mycoplasma sp. 1654_15 TaxID=2725994 RepID=UPI0014491636|nr:substrate-binding domain-containing protein [Mycoplasma sp. 1654_15]QJB71403.1 sugar ABC transporter substrate-binding protein [Mycoplasma sp. 1654_15]